MLLGLDLGQHLGWVLGPPDGGPPLTTGTKKLKETTQLGPWLASCDAEIKELVSMRGVTAIAIEQPFLGESYYPARKLLALLGHVHYWAHWYDIHAINEIPIATGKKALSGYGKAEGPQMIGAALKWGCPVTDEHQAHAAGIWKAHVFGA